MKPVCLGLKSDLTRVVDFGSANNFCKAHKMNYFEISIKNNDTVKRFFYEFGGVMFDLVKGKK